ncbi:MAG: cytochrome c biogenesis protein CcdA [Candidatus Sericytochromatia bacterium]|nr:cytochrome c biogenesis protein CcdA [Candidatus Tanganyikabacteria bacterium]
MSQINTAVAFGAGIVSFLSPCVLPLVPGYLSFVAGVSMDQLKGEGGSARGRVLINTLAFVLGFSLVFILLGASATAVGSFLLAKQRLIAQIAGVVVIVFGLHTMGLIRIPWLYQEKRAQITNKPAGVLGAFLVGLAFAFGWTPCIGPILASILSLAAAEETLGAGIGLLAVYSLGLGIPFLLTALAFDKLITVFDQVKKHMRAVEIVSGLLLVGVGILLMSDGLTKIAAWAQRIPFLNQLAL